MPKLYAGDEDTYDANIPVPADGDAMNERICAPAWKKSANRTAYIRKRIPQSYAYAAEGADPDPIWTYANGGALELVTATAATFKLDIPSCLVGDKLRVDVTLSYSTNENDDFTIYGEYIDQYGGAAPAQGHIAGCVFDATDGQASTGVQNLSIAGLHTVTLAGTTRITVALNAPTFAGMDDFSIWTAAISVLRFAV